MRIAILGGAGAMGSVFGARLALGGADVTLLDVNDAHLEVIERHGLVVDLDTVQHRVRLPAMRPEAFEGGVEVILLFTKIFHTGNALTSVASVLGDAAVFSLQNGIGNAERIAAHVPRERIILGMTLTPAEFLGPGRVASHGQASTQFYALDGWHKPVLDDLEAALSSGGIDARQVPDIQIAIWEKVAFNCAMNAICALTDGTPGAIGASDSARALARGVVREVVSVAKASGVAVKRDRIETLMRYAYTHHLMHEPSMLQDRKAGRRTEVDALNGAVAERGEALGLDVPLNRTLADLVRLTESARMFRREQGR